MNCMYYFYITEVPAKKKQKTTTHTQKSSKIKGASGFENPTWKTQDLDAFIMTSLSNDTTMPQMHTFWKCVCNSWALNISTKKHCKNMTHAYTPFRKNLL